jgi:hypothetical protein
MCELGKQDQMLKSSGICHLSNSRTRGVAMRPSMRCSGERSKEINTKIGQRYLTPVALEDPRVGPIIAAAGDVMIGLTPQAWRSVVYLKRADKSSAPHRRNQRAINCQALTAITKSTEPQ